MDREKSFILILFLSHFLIYTSGEKHSCERIQNYNGIYEDCTCQYMVDNKPSGIVSLYQIAKNGVPLFKDEPTNDTSRDGTKYSYNPCTPFTEKACHKTAVCQAASATLYYPAGFQNTTEYGISADGNVTLTYTAGPRTTIVTLVCDPSVNVPALLTVGEFPDDKEHYFLYLTHRCACPGKCAPPGLGGLSTGSVIVIIFFVVVIVYFVGGMIFLKFVSHQEGADIIPNRSFWGSLPGLIKEGFQYFFGTLLCRKSSYEQF